MDRRNGSVRLVDQNVIIIGSAAPDRVFLPLKGAQRAGREDLMTAAHPSPAGKRMPAVFIGHGSPENALEENAFTRAWKDLARSLPRPKAILSISAHWLTEGTAVTAMPQPRTIHDFYGFPEALYKINYPSAGSPEIAARIAKSVASVKVQPDREWGLDHGTWSVLANMYPQADIPVMQLSLDYYLPPLRQYQIGRELGLLRDEGILILGSGNLVHNLETIAMDAPPYGWALEFDTFVEQSLAARDDDALIQYTRQKTARLAHPTYDHYLPLLYVLGACENETPRQFNEGIFGGSVGMRCAVFGE
jgi:4,5-DOPA dioxygenase extradiol